MAAITAAQENLQQLKEVVKEYEADWHDLEEEDKHEYSQLRRREREAEYDTSFAVPWTLQKDADDETLLIGDWCPSLSLSKYTAVHCSI
jgi:hypothetical protein